MPQAPVPQHEPAGGSGRQTAAAEGGVCPADGTDREARSAAPEDAPAATVDAPAATARRGRRTAPGVPDVPLPRGERRRLRRFALLTVAVAALVVAVVAGFNAVVDPYGTIGTGLFPTVTWSDRALKADLARALPDAPQVVILGSSRAMKLEPSYITTTTGLTAFNAGVSSGRPIDAWAFVNLIHDAWPQSSPGYLWLLDVEAFRTWPPDPGLINTPGLARYLPDDLRRDARLKDLKLLVSLDTAGQSLKSLRERLRGAADTGADDDFDADGFRRRDYHDARAQAGVPLATELRKTIRQAQGTYREYRRLDLQARRYFEKTLRFMNDEGATPVIVLSPQQPQVTAAVGAAGWNARRRQLLTYLHGLQERFRFLLLDYTDVRSFGGDPDEFYDGYHMTVPNTRRLIDAVLEQDPEALRSRP